MDASSVSVLWYRRSKPLGKVRRRVQDLRIPSSYYDLIPSKPTMDLSHNESARLAADSLLSQGLEGYHEMLNAEGEVDFLSELEKNYILENGRDGSTADDGDGELESSSAGSQSATQCPTVSADLTEAGLDLSRPKDVKRTGPVLGDFSVEVFFQSDSRAAGMKDLVREFITKAKMALAIVMDSFSDVELLCDLLEASKKRNVSVHLLLDHLNLNLFISMWQDLKLISKNFPKLSVRSIHGQNYCAKTGRKLTGQIAESFIISDWTEVLTGSYSFSWLSWQVHRSLAVLVKGGAVKPFHQEFHRLHSSSKPVPGFVTYITVPHTLPPNTALQAAQDDNTRVSESKASQTQTAHHWALNEDAQNTQTKEQMPALSNFQSPELECSKDNTQPLQTAGSATQMHEKPPNVDPKPLVQSEALQNECVTKPKHSAGGVCLPIATAAERNVMTQESKVQHTAFLAHGQHRTVLYQSPFKTNSNLEHHAVGTEGCFLQQRNRDRLMKPSEVAAGLNWQRRQWSSLNFKPKVEFVSDHPKVLSPPASQQKQANTGLQFHLTHQRGYMSSMGHRRQDQPQRPPVQSQPTTETLVSTPTAMAAQFKPCLDAKLFPPGTGSKLSLQPHSSPQVKPCPKLIWMPQSQAARPRAVARQCSFNTTYGVGQQTGGQAGWRQVHSNMNMSLGRSKSMTDGRGAGRHPSRT